jgi:hypothetical protein
MPYTVSGEIHQLEDHPAFGHPGDAHRVSGRAAALSGAARVEDLEAVARTFVERKVRVTEHHRLGPPAEPTSQPLEAAPPRTGVVDHGDASAAGLDHPLGGKEAPELFAIDVPMDPYDWRPDGLELVQYRSGHEVAGVKQQVGGGDALDALIGEPPGAAREVGVGNYGDEHQGLTDPTSAASRQALRESTIEARSRRSGTQGEKSLERPTRELVVSGEVNP